VHLRLDRKVVAFFKANGNGHITRVQAVLRGYVDAQKRVEGSPVTDTRVGFAGCVELALGIYLSD
jgi:hypothetical protein